MMRVGLLGTGVVGETLATALVGLGHDVCMGSRSTPHAGSQAWAAATEGGASTGTFAGASEFGELIVNCTAGVHSLTALQAVGAASLAGKVLIDVANPLDFDGGFPPRLSVAGEDSLGEQIQRAFPKALVVKALNTVTASVMVNPSALAEQSDLFIAGDAADAKAFVTDLLVDLGWSRERVRDLGGIEAARATETYLMFWIRLMGAMGSAQFNIRVVPGEAHQ